MSAGHLKKLQSEFSDFVMHGRNEDRLIEQLCAPKSRHSVQGLDVYRDAYFIRLEAALAHDFPACERILGQEEFARLAGDYVVAQPSVSPSLRDLGKGFADWLRVHTGAAIADLAEIEWAVMRVFDGPDCVPVDSASMEQFAPEDWASLSVELVPTLTLLSQTSNADDVWCDRQGEIKLQNAAAKTLAISRNENMQPNLTILDNRSSMVLIALSKEGSLASASESLADLATVDEIPELLAKALLTAFAHNWVSVVSNSKQERS